MLLKAVLADLEEDARQNLKAYVTRELSQEYAPKHRSKGSKLGTEALLDAELSGEKLKGQVREQGKIYKIDMTFPLFDLDGDYTLILCSCLRDTISLEVQRCHHMYFFQQETQKALEALEAPPAIEDPIQGLETLLESSGEDEGERYLKTFRFRWLWDSERFTLKFEEQSRLRYEPHAAWVRARNLTLEDWLKLGSHQSLTRANTPEQQVYDLLELAATQKLEIAAGQRTLAIETNSFRFDVSEDEDGLNVRPDLPLHHKAVAGRGYIGWHERTATLELIRLEARDEQFAQYLSRMKKPFPLSHKQRVLELLARMDLSVFRMAEEEGELEAPSYEPLVRLTPFKQGGMKIELRVQLEPGLVLAAGEGDEQLPKLSGGGRWQRDFAEERRIVRSLVSTLDFVDLPEPETGTFIAYNDHIALNCVARIEEQKGQARFLLEWPSHLAKKSFEFAPPLKTENLKVSVGEKKDWLSVEGYFELDDGHRLSLRELLATLQKRGRYLKLPDGRWSLLPEHFRQKLEPLAQAVEIDGDELNFEIGALGDPETADALANFPFQEKSQSFWKLVSQARRSQQLAIPLPKGLKAELRPYQQDGFRWMARLAEWGLGACLADDMGLGKTVQTLAVLLARAGDGPSLVIAPSSLCYNWQSEAQKFAPDLRIKLLKDLPRGGSLSLEAGEVLVASYGLVMRYAERLAETSWNVLVLDEAQLIKNAQTKTAQAVQTLPARWKLALSGTPIENHLGDLWSLFHTLSPGLFGEWERFKRSFVLPIDKGDSEEARVRLKNKIAPFVLRRMKQDYLTELPAKTEVDLWIDLSTEEQNLYDALRGEAIEKIQRMTEEAETKEDNGQDNQIQMHVLAALTRLRQAACHRTLVDEGYIGSSSKQDALLDRVRELSEAGHAALVFSQFTRFLRLIESELKRQGLRVAYLDGQTPLKERARLVADFQAGDYDVFLISLKAGGTGLTLTRASYVFHLDPWWNPAVENQASDRAYRMGQKQAVTVYRLRSRGTIEEMIQAMHGEKRALVASVLEGRAAGEQPKWKELWSMLWPETSRKKPSSKREEEGLI